MKNPLSKLIRTSQEIRRMVEQDKVFENYHAYRTYRETKPNPVYVISVGYGKNKRTVNEKFSSANSADRWAYWNYKKNIKYYQILRIN